MCKKALFHRPATTLGLVEQAFWRMPLFTEWITSGPRRFSLILLLRTVKRCGRPWFKSSVHNLQEKEAQTGAKASWQDLFATSSEPSSSWYTCQFILEQSVFAICFGEYHDECYVLLTIHPCGYCSVKTMKWCVMCKKKIQSKPQHRLQTYLRKIHTQAMHEPPHCLISGSTSSLSRILATWPSVTSAPIASFSIMSRKAESKSLYRDDHNTNVSWNFRKSCQCRFQSWYPHRHPNTCRWAFSGAVNEKHNSIDSQFLVVLRSWSTHVDTMWELSGVAHWEWLLLLVGDVWRRAVWQLRICLKAYTLHVVRAACPDDSRPDSRISNSVANKQTSFCNFDDNLSDWMEVDHVGHPAVSKLALAVEIWHRDLEIRRNGAKRRQNVHPLWIVCILSEPIMSSTMFHV